MLEENGKIYDYQNAIGMVITCDSKKMTDVKCNENGWTHAYVMGFENLGTGRWGGMERIEEGITPMTKDDEITVLGAKKNITSPVKIKIVTMK